MKLDSFIQYRIIFFVIYILVYILHSVSANNHILEIYSKYQLLNVLTNKILFKNDVTLKYKGVELYADQMIITHDSESKCLSMIKAYGSPIILKYNQESGCMTFAQSSSMSYNAANNVITFFGNVCIEQSGNFIYSNNIVYYIDQRKMQAVAQKDNRVLTILRINSI